MKTYPFDRLISLIFPEALQESINFSALMATPVNKPVHTPLAAPNGPTGGHEASSPALAALRPPSVGTEAQAEQGMYRGPPALPADHANTGLVATRVSQPPSLTRSTLRAYACAPGLSQEEARQRLEVERRILAAQSKLWSFLSDTITISGSLDLWPCSALTQLPDGLSVGGDFYLNGCRALTQLPDGLSVGGDLNLAYCTGLTQLPDGLSVGSYLELRNCTGLTQLPDGLKVGGHLDLRNCTGLTQLPDSLSVGGYLDLQGCTNITSLPDDITTWGRRRNGITRRIDLTGTGLSEAVLGRLQAAHAPGMLFTFDMTQAEQSSSGFAHLDAALRFWLSTQTPAAPLDTAPWHLSPGDTSALQQFLGRLCQTADYTNPNVRPHLQLRVVSLLRAIDQDAALRTQVLDCIAEALQSCNDRVILVMNQVELAVRVHHAEQGSLDGAALRQLLLGLMQLDVVHAEARQKVATMHFVDEIEVFLAYEIRLRDVLGLPVSTQSMLYEGMAGVTSADIDRAQRKAQAAVADPNKVAAYLATSSPWQHHLRREAAARWSYAALKPRQLAADVVLAAERCPLTLEYYADLRQPLVWQRGQVCRVYEAEDLMRHWVDQGTDPSTRQQLAIETLFRPL